MENSTSPSRLSIWFSMLVIYIVWGSTYLAIRVGVQTIPPFYMAATRFLIAGGLLYAWQRFSGKAAPSRQDWLSAGLVGLLLLTGGNGILSWSEQRVPSGISALLVGAAPIWMVLIDLILPKSKKPNFQVYLGILVGFMGIVLLVGPLNILGNAQQLDRIGVLGVLCSSVLWASGSILNRETKFSAAPLLAPAMQMLVGAVGLIVIGTLVGDWHNLHISQISMPSLMGLLYLIFFGSLAGYVSYIWLLRVAPTPLVSTYAYVNPLIAIFIGSLLAQEELNLRILVAAIIIISSVGIINLAKHKR